MLTPPPTLTPTPPPTPTPTPDNRRALNRMKGYATILLALAIGLFILAKSHHDAGLWAWLSAFAEAAMVGALADWFAVVALFRHPLGLPIPHTAILPANKARVADNLAAFVRDKFLGTETLLARAQAFDPAGRLAAWLAQPESTELLGRKAAEAVAQALSFSDDAHVKAMLHAALVRRARQYDVSGAAGNLLSALTAERRHQQLLDEGLQELAKWLERTEVQQALADRIVTVAGQEYPSLIGALGFVGLKADDLGRKFAAGLVRGANHWLQEISADPQHERRLALDAAVERFIERLKADAGFKQRLDEYKQRWLENPQLKKYVSGLWDEFTDWLRTDLQRPDSAVRAQVAGAAAALAKTLAHDAALRAALNAHLHDALEALAPELREGIARHIAATVKRWDDATLVRDVESSVGRDLQFIRVNGTLVGGLVGILIHALSLLAF